MNNLILHHPQPYTHASTFIPHPHPLTTHLHPQPPPPRSPAPRTSSTATYASAGTAAATARAPLTSLPLRPTATATSATRAPSAGCVWNIKKRVSECHRFDWRRRSCVGLRVLTFEESISIPHPPTRFCLQTNTLPRLTPNFSVFSFSFSPTDQHLRRCLWRGGGLSPCVWHHLPDLPPVLDPPPQDLLGGHRAGKW